MAVGAVDCRLVAVLLATTMLHHVTDARSDGPPVTQGNLCSDMTPQHGGSSQTTEPPYTISTSAACYTPGQAVSGKRLINILINLSIHI